MHLLTSSIFLPSYVAAFEDSATKVLVIRSWLRIALGLVIERGKPKLHIAHLMAQSATPSPAQSIRPQPHRRAILASVSEPAPWLPVIRSAFQHPDSHQIKAIRSLVYASQHMGGLSEGGVRGAERLEAGDQLDGSVFVRAAGVIMASTGWVGDGEAPKEWDRSCLVRPRSRRSRSPCRGTTKPGRESFTAPLLYTELDWRRLGVARSGCVARDGSSLAHRRVAAHSR